LKCNYCPLDEEALLHITGPESLTFLQGQTTCDTRIVDASHAVPGIYCTPQGRVVCDFLLCQLGPEHFALRMRQDIRTNSSAMFGKYIIFSKAKLQDQRDDWQAFAIWGPDAAASVAQIFGDSPNERFASHSGEGFVLVQMDTNGEEFECYLDSSENSALQQQMDQRMKCSTESDWQALQIANGVARIEAATIEEFIPQVLNYDLTGHISFSKGCYTGQEVVARLHYRGKPKRRTYLATSPEAKNVAAGTNLFHPGETQSIGNVVNSIRVQNEIHALVAATTKGLDKGLSLGGPDGPLLTLGELPYVLESE
jgi:folate-binding protein YgfZ